MVKKINIVAVIVAIVQLISLTVLASMGVPIDGAMWTGSISILMMSIIGPPAAVSEKVVSNLAISDDSVKGGWLDKASTMTTLILAILSLFVKKK